MVSGGDQGVYRFLIRAWRIGAGGRERKEKVEGRALNFERPEELSPLEVMTAVERLQGG
jgi:hypothetical protein